MGKKKEAKKLKPPYYMVSSYKKFLRLIHRRRPDKIDLEFIRLNIVKGRHEYKIFSGLRFLGVIAENGTPTEKLDLLRVTGDEYKKNLEQVVKEAYQHLFSKIVVEEAKPDDLVNYFIGNFGYSTYTAQQALQIFVFLCGEAGIPLSEKLKTTKIEKMRTFERAKRVKEPKVKQKRKIGAGEPQVPEGMHKTIWGNDVFIYLRKGNKNFREKIAKIAKQFIDMYVEEEESQTEK